MKSHYTSEYRRKLITLDDVPGLLRSDTDVIVAQCASEPQGCMGRFHLAKDRVRDIKVFSVLTLKPYDFYSLPEMAGHFELCSWFHAPGSRAAVAAGLPTVTYVPNMLHRAGIDRLQVRRPHLFFGTCTPPDEKGFVSLSLGITYEKDVLEAAEFVVLEVNDRLPRTFGDTQLHIRDVDHFVEFPQQPPTLPPATPDEVSIRIGGHIAELVEDGSTIQLGIGDIPNAAALSLREKKDLGVHTEMLVDSMVDLYEMGVITNKRKTIYKDKFVCTFAMGSQRLYDWLDNNQAVEFLRGRYVNDPCVVRRNARMVSLNTCLMVDLTGQVASESIGTRQYSGTGGQTDTATGAVEGFDGLGKSIIACRSTARNGSLSSIPSVLPEGTAVTLHRSNTDWVVTEHGAVRLRGLTVRERAQALIGIAHPDFRPELTEQARRYGFL